jgi:ComF family protein
MELFFPGRCLLCGKALAFNSGKGEPLCLACRAGLIPLAAPRRCAICSLPLSSEKRLCTRCRRRTYEFQSNLSLFEYLGEPRELLYQYKFRNRLRLAPILADFYARALRVGFPGAVLIPAPGSPQAVRRRGWDPVERLCRVLRTRHGFRVRRVLERRAGSAQKLLGYEERRRNLRGTIALREGTPGELVLIDDVFTSGATASECARLLLQGGASRVRVLTLAIDVP